MVIELKLTRSEKIKLIKSRYTIADIKAVIGNIEKPPCILKEELWFERAVTSGEFDNMWIIDINSLDDLEQIKWRFEVLQESTKPIKRDYLEDLAMAEKLSHES